MNEYMIKSPNGQFRNGYSVQSGIEKARESFLELDIDGDGRISIHEAGNPARWAYQKGEMTEEEATIFGQQLTIAARTADADEDGYVDEVENLALSVWQDEQDGQGFNGILIGVEDLDLNAGDQLSDSNVWAANNRMINAWYDKAGDDKYNDYAAFYTIHDELKDINSEITTALEAEETLNGPVDEINVERTSASNLPEWMISVNEAAREARITVLERIASKTNNPTVKAQTQAAIEYLRAGYGQPTPTTNTTIQTTAPQTPLLTEETAQTVQPQTANQQLTLTENEFNQLTTTRDALIANLPNMTGAEREGAAKRIETIDSVLKLSDIASLTRSPGLLEKISQGIQTLIDLIYR